MNLTIWKIVEMIQVNYSTGPLFKEQCMPHSAKKTIV